MSLSSSVPFTTERGNKITTPTLYQHNQLESRKWRMIILYRVRLAGGRLMWEVEVVGAGIRCGGGRRLSSVNIVKMVRYDGATSPFEIDCRSGTQ